MVVLDFRTLGVLGFSGLTWATQQDYTSLGIVITCLCFMSSHGCGSLYSGVSGYGIFIEIWPEHFEFQGIVITMVIFLGGLQQGPTPFRLGECRAY
jgi:hypothetical protein